MSNYSMIGNSIVKPNPFLDFPTLNSGIQSTEKGFGFSLGIQQITPVSPVDSKYNAFKTMPCYETNAFSSMTQYSNFQLTPEKDEPDSKKNKRETPVDPDLFRDFAVSAFNELKRELQQPIAKGITSSKGIELSNTLF